MVKIFIANLSDQCSNDDLRNLFSQYGNVTEADKLPDKPIGFVHMDDQEGAEKAVRKLDGLSYKGRWLKVELSSMKPVKIFIGNVAPEATSSDLRKVFEGTGLEIQKCDKVEGKGIGFAHVCSSKGVKEINSLGGITKQQRGDYDDYGAMDPGMPMGMNMGMNMPLPPGRGGFMRGRGGFRGRPAPYPPMRGRGGFGGFGFGGGEEYYPMGNHVNKMWGGGYTEPVTLEGPFGGGIFSEDASLEGTFGGQGPSARGIAGTVKGWANEALNELNGKKDEHHNRKAEKKAVLFDNNHSSMLSMLESGQLSDYKLKCGEEVVEVHKMILAAKSPYFVELIMKNPDECEITNVDIETLKLLVRFMYTSLVDVANISPSLILRLLKAAETYQVEMVREGLESALMERVELETVVEYLTIAEELNMVDLKAVALKFVTANSSVVKKRDDFRLKLRDYPDLLMELFQAISGNSEPAGWGARLGN